MTNSIRVSAAVGALNAGNVIGNYGYLPSRATWMLDYSPSEFSRLRAATGARQFTDKVCRTISYSCSTS